MRLSLRGSVLVSAPEIYRNKLDTKSLFHVHVDYAHDSHPYLKGTSWVLVDNSMILTGSLCANLARLKGAKCVLWRDYIAAYVER